jgi:outer membrane protein TolC
LIAAILTAASVLSSKPGLGREPGAELTRSNIDLKLSEVRELVLQRNETLQGRLLSFEAQHRRARGEYGLFEPSLYGSFTHEVNNRKNTAEQQASLLGQPTFSETNNNVESGLETFVPIGTRLKLGYTLRDLKNSLQPVTGVTNSEYQTFFGVSVTQPLLKSFGLAASMASVRLAGISNKINFQEYRRDLMAVVSAAEATYWNLYLAQEQVRFFEESVTTAETILRDNRARLQAGKGSELEVLEAQAGAGLRKAKLAEARQKDLEAGNRLISLYAQEAPADGSVVRTVDVPAVPGPTAEYQVLRQALFAANPDYLIAQEKLQQDRVRLGFAQNQRLPQLDLKGSYGLNGLGSSPGSSWSDVEHQSEPSWYVGAELRVPLGGGIKTRNDLIAARLDLQSSEVSLHGVEIEILNGMNTAWRKLQSTRGNVTNYQSAVQYNNAVLQAALTRLDAGKIESRKVLEIEGDLLEAKVSLAESLVQCQLAALEMETLGGVLLQSRHLELSQGQLQKATAHFDHTRGPADPQYQTGLNAVERSRAEGEQDSRFSKIEIPPLAPPPAIQPAAPGQPAPKP